VNVHVYDANGMELAVGTGDSRSWRVTVSREGMPNRWRLSSPSGTTLSGGLLNSARVEKGDVIEWPARTFPSLAAFERDLRGKE
jgi:hypothetical protein